MLDGSIRRHPQELKEQPISIKLPLESASTRPGYPTSSFERNLLTSGTVFVHGLGVLVTLRSPGLRERNRHDSLPKDGWADPNTARVATPSRPVQIDLCVCARLLGESLRITSCKAGLADYGVCAEACSIFPEQFLNVCERRDFAGAGARHEGTRYETRPPRVQFRLQTLQSFNVASCMAFAALCSQRPFRRARSFFSAAIALGEPR